MRGFDGNGEYCVLTYSSTETHEPGPKNVPTHRLGARASRTGISTGHSWGLDVGLGTEYVSTQYS